MSYCVHCGVELDPSAAKCALCNTPVMDPKTVFIEKPAEDKPFSDEIVIPKNIQRRFIAYVVTMVMLIPDIILFFVNVCFFREQHWSVYISATTLLIWVLCVFPFYTKKLKPYLMWAFDTLAVCAYSYFLFLIGRSDPGVFLSFFTVIALFAIASLIFIIWIRANKRHWTGILFHLFLDGGIISFIAGFFISAFVKNPDFFYVGLICALCFFALSGFFIYCNRSKRIRAWFDKAFNL